MASLYLQTTSDGRRFFKIYVSRGRGQSCYTTRWYWPDGWSKKTAEREAQKVAAEFERKCKEGEVLTRSQKREKEVAEAAEAEKLKTVKQYGDGVFLPIKETTLSGNARSQYKQVLNNHVYPKIGHMLLADVTPAIITKLLVEFQKNGYAHATCVKLYNILNGLFDMAFMDDSIPINPMLKVKRPAPRKDEKEKPETEKVLTAEQLRYVLDCAKHEPLKWYVYMVLSADTWARRGELCALEWSDINFQESTITICRNVQYNGDDGVYVTTPKNGKSRVVDIGADTLELLRQWRLEQSKNIKCQYVFNQDNLNERIYPSTPTWYFEKFAKKYGVEGLHPHALRHTGASIAITNGADVASVSERLGHSDKSITLRMYTHANVDSIRRAGQIMRNALNAEAV